MEICVLFIRRKHPRTEIYQTLAGLSQTVWPGRWSVRGSQIRKIRILWCSSSFNFISSWYAWLWRRFRNVFQIHARLLIGPEYRPIKSFSDEKLIFSNNLVSFIYNFNIYLASYFGNYGRFRLRSCTLGGAINLISCSGSNMAWPSVKVLENSKLLQLVFLYM